MSDRKVESMNTDISRFFVWTCTLLNLRSKNALPMKHFTYFNLLPAHVPFLYRMYMYIAHLFTGHELKLLTLKSIIKLWQKLYIPIFGMMSHFQLD